MSTIHMDDFHPEMNLFDALSPEAFKKLLGIARREAVEAGSLLHTMIYILSERLRKANVHATSVASTSSNLAGALAELLGA